MGRPTPKIPEAEVAALVVDYLGKKGHDVYQEVPCSTGVADIVVLNGAEDWIVETKVGWSLDLLVQAMARRRDAHRVFVAVPDARDWEDRADLFRSLGIGTYRVRPHERYTDVEHAGRMMARGFDDAVAGGCTYACPCKLGYDLVKLVGGAPVLQAPSWQLREHVRPQHKTHARAGARNGKGVFHWSPWRESMQNLADFVARHPEGVRAGAAAKGVKHHYPNDRSASASLAHWASLGRAPGVIVVMLKNRNWFFPSFAVDAIAAALTAHGWTPAEMERTLEVARLDAMMRKAEHETREAPPR